MQGKKYGFWFCIFIVPLLTGVILSEKLISHFVLKQIPEEFILRDNLKVYQLIDFSLIFKLFSYLSLSLTILLFSIRFKRKFLIIPLLGGLAGIISVWIPFAAQLIEMLSTFPRLNSTTGLVYLLLPILETPNAFAGVFAGFSGVLLYAYFKNIDSLEIYRSLKSRKTYLTEGFVYLFLAASLTTGYSILTYPDRLANKASSVRTSISKIEHLYKKANENSDLKLLSSIASNPKTPVNLLTEIYNSSIAHYKTDEKKYLNIFSSLAGNRKAPVQLLLDISKRRIPGTEVSLALNSNAPADVLFNLIFTDNFRVKREIATNMNTPGDALEVLSDDNSRLIRLFVVRNRNVSDEVLWKLADDKDDEVRKTAEEKLSLGLK